MKRRLDRAAFVLLTALVTSAMPGTARPDEPGPWPLERAAAWSREHPWLVGCNYIPSTAINQLEMWQADTFDPATIDRELGWAEGLGFNSVRVFLHDLLWEQDAPGFLGRMDRFLEIADRHRIGVVFVVFDAVWDPIPQLGEQRAPKPGLHNSGWVQSPGKRILSDPCATRRAEALRRRRDRPVSRRPPGPRLGPVQRARQPQPIELRQARAGRQARAVAGFAEEDLRLGA